jgi:hypothetical protein
MSLASETSPTKTGERADMNQQAAAIVIAGALIAAAIALTNHWALHQDGGSTLLLNRWTGTVVEVLPGR